MDFSTSSSMLEQALSTSQAGWLRTKAAGKRVLHKKASMSRMSWNNELEMRPFAGIYLVACHLVLKSEECMVILRRVKDMIEKCAPNLVNAKGKAKNSPSRFLKFAAYVSQRCLVRGSVSPLLPIHLFYLRICPNWRCSPSVTSTTNCYSP
jgi:hypothetical protein